MLNSARKQANALDRDSQPVTPENKSQPAERRECWFQDVLEDDEVREALALRHAQEKAKTTINRTATLL
jgi:hypothetical protein